MVERLRRQLKSSLKASTDPGRWSEHLPWVMLGTRASIKEDLGCTPAELVYGTTLRIPEFLSENSSKSMDITSYVSRLKSRISQFTFTEPRSTGETVFIPPALTDSQLVFLHHDAVRRPLQRHEGPYKVLKHGAKTFTLDIKGKRQTVNIDCLKPAFLEMDPNAKPPVDHPASNDDAAVTPPVDHTTRSGRVVRTPDFFNP
ncbi:Uncharacterised protein r2_g3921 [Pycnogonum litorale]